MYNYQVNHVLYCIIRLKENITSDLVYPVQYRTYAKPGNKTNTSIYDFSKKPNMQNLFIWSQNVLSEKYNLFNLLPI